MKADQVITIVLGGSDLAQQAPGGFRYVKEMYEEAGLREEADAVQGDAFWRRMRILARALRREFGEQVALRAINPWTPGGLLFVVRHRVRQFPCLVIAGQQYAPDAPLDDLVEAVRDALQ